MADYELRRLRHLAGTMLANRVEGAKLVAEACLDLDRLRHENEMLKKKVEELEGKMGWQDMGRMLDL